MTHGSEPSDRPSPESLSSESERRRWQHKRAQFDSAINTARLFGVVQGLAQGSMRAAKALGIVLEVNSSKDQAQYVAEMLAMKKEFRDLARIEFSDEVAKFILEGSRLVPALTGGLASQMLMAMGHAAQNDAYLETVSSAVSALLSDLDHPLMPDARNYLRLLWDQMEATRRLKQTEALYTGPRVPSERTLERRSSGAVAAARPVPVQTHEPPKPVLGAHEGSIGSRVGAPPSPARTMIGLGHAPLQPHVEPPAPAVSETPKPRWVEAAAPLAPPEAENSSPTPTIPSPAMPSPVASSSKPAAESRRPPSQRWVVAEPKEEAASAATPPAPEQQPEPPAPRADSAMDLVGRVWREARSTSEPEEARGSAVPQALAPERTPSVSKIVPVDAAEPHPESSRVAFEPTLPQHEQDFFAAGEQVENLAAEVTAPASQPSLPAHRPPADTIVESQRFDSQRFNAAVEPSPGARQVRPSQTEIKIPTRGVPKWAIASVIAVALAASGLVLSLTLTSESENKSEAPKASASGAPKAAPSGKGAAPVASLARRPPRASAHPNAAGAPPPPPPPPAAPPVEPEPRAAAPTHNLPRNQEPASPPVHQGRPANPTVAPQVQPREPARQPPPAVESTSKKPSAEPSTKSPTVVTPPEVAKSLSPLDRIVAELRIISPDPVGIEDKARELARIIAKSKRKEAGQIIERLGPPIAVDPLSRDSTLEESLQTFAISVLGRVATDDDDTRAVDALLMLGEWVRNGGKGKQKALSALQTLSHESIVKMSAPRLRALKTAQAQAD